MNRRTFQQLADERILDATVLLEHRRYSAAYYLAGYAVECALKACIAKQTKRYDFPPRRSHIEDIYTHDLRRLVKAAGLDKARIALEAQDIEFSNNWNTVILWTEQSRYNTSTRDEVRRLLRAVADEDHGVLQWVRRSW